MKGEISMTTMTMMMMGAGADGGGVHAAVNDGDGVTCTMLTWLH